MKELWYDIEHWLQRNEIFDWCEQNYGPYGPDRHGNKRWIFYSDGDTQPQINTRLHLFLDEEDATLFRLRWG